MHHSIRCKAIGGPRNARGCVAAAKFSPASDQRRETRQSRGSSIVSSFNRHSDGHFWHTAPIVDNAWEPTRSGSLRTTDRIGVLRHFSDPKPHRIGSASRPPIASAIRGYAVFDDIGPIIGVSPFHRVCDCLSEAASRNGGVVDPHGSAGRAYQVGLEPIT